MSNIPPLPTNPLVNPMLTDMYQISMTYAYWKGGRQNDHSVFELFFRKTPFGGEFCIFAGLDEDVRFNPRDIEYLKTVMTHCEPEFWDYLASLDCSQIKIFAMREGEIVFSKVPLIRVEGPLAVAQLLETTLLNLINFPSLITTNAARMRLAVGESTMLLEFGLRRAQGPDGAVSASKYSVMGGFNGTSNVLAGQLFGIDVKGTHAHAFVMCYTSLSDLDSRDCSLVRFVKPTTATTTSTTSTVGAAVENTSSSSASSSHSSILSAHPSVENLEQFKIKRLEDEDENKLEGEEGLNLEETNDRPLHVATSSSSSQALRPTLSLPTPPTSPSPSDTTTTSSPSFLPLLPPSSSSSLPNVVDFKQLVIEKRMQLGYTNTNEGELTAFISYALSFPSGFLALVDTYDTLRSGVLNFVCVGLALKEMGYRPIGIRLDSGDLAYLSRETRKIFKSVDKKLGLKLFTDCMIAASNDISEDVLISLAKEGHEINLFGIGTQLVTCSRQPALGCVYKLVQINNQPRTKLSQDVSKMVIPCRKSVYRLIGKDGLPIMDVMCRTDEPGEQIPTAGEKIYTRHPFAEAKRAMVTPSGVEELLLLFWDGSHGLIRPIPSLFESRSLCLQRIQNMRGDHVRSLNPTPYKVSLTSHLYDYMRELWIKEMPPSELS